MSERSPDTAPGADGRRVSAELHGEGLIHRLGEDAQVLLFWPDPHDRELIKRVIRRDFTVQRATGRDDETLFREAAARVLAEAFRPPPQTIEVLWRPKKAKGTFVARWSEAAAGGRERSG